MNLSSQTVSMILILAAVVLAALGFLHPADLGSKGQIFTFAGSIVTGAFALLRGDKPTDPTALPSGSKTVTTEAVETPSKQ